MSELHSDQFEFCHKFEHASVIGTHLRQILGHLNDTNILAVILIGSTARGELSLTCRVGGEPYLLSDYEFLVATSSPVSPEVSVQISTQLARLECALGGGSPLFHIDVSWVTLSELRRLPRKFQIFEARTCGVSLVGEDIAHKLPIVTLDNLDFRELNEVLIWRLWALALYMPLSLLRDHQSRALFSYVICRNALDLVSWALPYDGVLLASFRKRADYAQSHFLDLKMCQAIDSAFLNWLDIYMRGKFDIEFTLPTSTLYTRVIQQFVRAVQALVSQCGGVNWETDLEVCASPLFHDRQFRRKAYEVIRMWRGRGQWISGLRWLAVPKYSLTLAFLCYLHQSSVAHLESRFEDRMTYLERACMILNRLALPNWPSIAIDHSRDFVDSWSQLRRSFAEFLMVSSSSVGAKRAYLEKILEFDYDEDFPVVH